jgi:hypothetical protein
MGIPDPIESKKPVAVLIRAIRLCPVEPGTLLVFNWGV